VHTSRDAEAGIRLPTDLPARSRTPAAFTSGGWVWSFAALALIWGCSFLLVKVGLAAFSPVQLALVRCSLGAGSLLLMLRVRRDKLPRGAVTWGRLFVAALLFNSVPFTLIAAGEVHVSSILAGVINAATPLVALLAALVFFPSEKPSGARMAGLACGFVGVLVVLGVWRGIGGAAALSIASCLAAVVCYGVAFPYARRFLSAPSTSSLSLATGQLLCATAQLLPFLAVGGPPDRPWRPSVVTGMLALGVLGSGLAYILSYQIISRAGDGVASSVTYVLPVVAVIAGTAVLGEHLHWNEVVGALFICVGIAFGQRSQGTRPRTWSASGMKARLRRTA
jgi:drug/metabolite transporter (DMT)-like permease